MLLLLSFDQAMAEVAKQGLYPNPLVTELLPLGSGADRFWGGEDYHQNYYADNPTQGYCRAVVAPKVSKFRCRRLGLWKVCHLWGRGVQQLLCDARWTHTLDLCETVCRVAQCK